MHINAYDKFEIDLLALIFRIIDISKYKYSELPIFLNIYILKYQNLRLIFVNIFRNIDIQKFQLSQSLFNRSTAPERHKAHAVVFFI